MLNFVTIGEWREGDVEARSAPSSRRVVGEVEAVIDRAWAEVARRPGVHLFDGPMCRLESLHARNDGKLELTLSETSYRIFLGTNLYHPELAAQYGRDVMANPVGLSCALVSDDGFLVMGKRNAAVAYYPNRIHPFAGALEPKDIGNVFEGMRRELREELSLDATAVAEISCLGIAEDRKLVQPEMIFRARTLRTRSELSAQLEAEEHRGCWWTPATCQGIEAALADYREMTPVAVAALLMWGQREFGEAWFAQHVSALPAS
jgi:8-oxo-dGTP pyrophosphatase MutT (NUDIX family)